VTIPDGVTNMGSWAFAYCEDLRSITIPDGVTNLKFAFYNCKSLESVTIPDGVTDIENAFDAFYDEIDTILKIVEEIKNNNKIFKM
jgi:hypothetical protein